ncbi:MAG: 4Fe-4S dicluster domain-containing protein [Dehalococcoidia bacterium]|nr:4Fe-4S dicluster domain-containing protein [Dehalococcoidia bacterium]
MTTGVSKDNRSITADSARCAGCLTCMLHCSFRSLNKFNLSKSYISVERLTDRENEFEITFTDGCDACLLCGRHCPYGALTGNQTEDTA